MDLLVILIIIVEISGVLGVEILSMIAPNSVEAGQDIILDCQYDYRPEERDQLDIKWYFNSSPSPIYQWLPAIDTGPQVIDKRFLEHLDLNFEINDEKYEKHRALHLVNTTHNFSGSYMCKVSSFLDEDFDQKEVFILVPPTVISIQTEAVGEDSLSSNVTCTATGIYPVPEGRILFSVGSESVDTSETVITIGDNGLADITISTKFTRSSDLRGVQHVGITCTILIPNTDIVYTHNSSLNINFVTEGDESSDSESDHDLSEPDAEKESLFLFYDIAVVGNVTDNETLFNETDLLIVENSTLADDYFLEIDTMFGNVTIDPIANATGEPDYGSMEAAEPENQVEDASAEAWSDLDADPRISSGGQLTPGLLIVMSSLLVFLQL